MKVREACFTLGLFLLYASSAISQPLEVSTVVKNGSTLSGKKLSVHGFVVLDRHGLYLVSTKEFKEAIALNITKSTEEKSSNIKKLIKKIYRLPLSAPWTEIESDFYGTFREESDGVPKYIFDVDDVAMKN